MKNMDLFLDTMFWSADQTHLWHLQTNSYALHKALNKYYDGIRDGMDTVAEEYMGYAGKRLSATNRMPLKPFKNVEQVASHLMTVCKYLTALSEELGSKPETSHILAAVDVIRELIAKTKYLITLS